ncbi:MAG TPA: DGQHR domain-containing protein [Thermoanaerobaculia bacterium]|nr:DGQHR domain-containing protein [Thermoanaerobaculia bacterium]
MKRSYVFHGVLGRSADREVFLGFAPAKILHAVSFADVLDEETGRGYQRRPNPQHSLDFRRYIQKTGSTTIPLTFNARAGSEAGWKVARNGHAARLEISADAGHVLAQVDCQHRISRLHDMDVTLPFMCFLGVSEREEMEIFSVINSKAKGLSPSLLDFHSATLLASDLATQRPELFVALHLHNDDQSPWYRKLDRGGTSGLHRLASLRTMQKAVKRFLAQTRSVTGMTAEASAKVVVAFWSAVTEVLPDEWTTPRKHLLSKGVGVYALMTIAADLVTEEGDAARCDKQLFVARLADFLPQIDWTNSGALKGLGGEAGVAQAVDLVRAARKSKRLRVVHRG